MSKNTDNLTVFLDSFKIFGGRGFCARGVCSIFRESLLLGFIPVFVESSFHFVGKMGCPDGSKRTEAAGGFNIADNTAHNHWRCLGSVCCESDLNVLQ